MLINFFKSQAEALEALNQGKKISCKIDFNLGEYVQKTPEGIKDEKGKIVIKNWNDNYSFQSFEQWYIFQEDYFFGNPKAEMIKLSICAGTLEAFIVITKCSVFLDQMQVEGLKKNADDFILKTIIKQNPVSGLLNYEEGIIARQLNGETPEQQKERFQKTVFEGEILVQKTNLHTSPLYKKDNVLVHHTSRKYLIP